MFRQSLGFWLLKGTLLVSLIASLVLAGGLFPFWGKYSIRSAETAPALGCECCATDVDYAVYHCLHTLWCADPPWYMDTTMIEYRHCVDYYYCYGGGGDCLEWCGRYNCQTLYWQYVGCGC